MNKQIAGWLRICRKLVGFEVFIDDNKLLDLLNAMFEENKNGYDRDNKILTKWSDQNG